VVRDRGTEVAELPDAALPARFRTVSAPVVRFIWRSLGALGADRAALARDARLPVWALGDDTLRLDLEHLVALWRLGAEICGPGVGVSVARQWTRGGLHLPDYLCASAPTLADGLQTLVSYRHLLVHNPANRFELLEHARGLELHCQVCSGDEQIDALAAEFCLTLVLHISGRTLGRRIVPVSVSFASSPHPGRDQMHEAFATRDIEWGAERASLVLAHDDLESPLPTADPTLASILRAHAATMGGRPSDRDWLDEFRALLAADLPASRNALSTMSKMVAMSPRTLQRRLNEAHTSWNAEIDRARHEAAIRLLRHGRGRKEIAARLGYSDVRSLRRAVERWNHKELTRAEAVTP
jgi:AraC-like DNA-binding protein